MRSHNGAAVDRLSMDEAAFRLFYTAKSWLTDYALRCGYVERDEHNGVSTTLWNEHGTFHVRQHSDSAGRIFWDSFGSVREARARFTRAVRAINILQGPNS